MTDPATNPAGITVAVLLSVGRHPASGRARRAPTDAQALELAFALAQGGQVHALHAGDPANPALRDYLGMGLERLMVLAVPDGADPVEPLAAWLRGRRPTVVLAGCNAEEGEGSGMVPYLVARALDAAVVPDVVSLRLSGHRAELVQALPRGQRRALSAALPLVATVHPAAPAARPFAFGPARRGRIDMVSMDAPADAFLAECETRPCTARPPRLRVARGGSALDRLKAATEAKAGKGQLLTNIAPEEAAERIYQSLVEQGVVG